MKVLVVGGAGALGGHCAAHLAAKGHDVTIGGRNPAHPDTPMAKMPFLKGDYIVGDYTPEKLKGFDRVVFAAGNDPRHVPQGSDFAEFLYKANHEAVPAFFAACREAGVKKAVQLGSFYAQAAPELLEGSAYIRSRLAACEGARAEARDGFEVVSVNAPFMVGCVAGQPSALFEPYVAWAQGKLPIETFAPAGGTAFMSYRSLSEAIEGALERGENRKAYLVSDENLSFTEYFQMFFDAVGNSTKLETRDQENPLLPDVAIPQGRGNYIRIETDPAEVALLGYRQGDIKAAVEEVVAQYRT